MREEIKKIGQTKSQPLGRGATAFDLKGADLRGLILDGFCFVYTDLDHACLAGCSAKGTNFYEATLGELIGPLHSWQFFQENLEWRSDFTDLRDANLEGADFTEARVVCVRFDRANMHKATFRFNSVFNVFTGARITKAELFETRFYCSILDEVDLTGSLVGCIDDLRGATFAGSRLKGVKIENALRIESADWRNPLLSREQIKVILGALRRTFVLDRGRPINQLPSPDELWHEAAAKVDPWVEE
jgi:uncharacterized protein YjbI with pentapeptide repeats